MNELDPSTSTTFPSNSRSSETINVMAHYAAAADPPLDYAYAYTTSPADDADRFSGTEGIESCLTRRSSDGFSTVEPVHPLWWSKYVDVVLE
jgi:hypothetical protein